MDLKPMPSSKSEILKEAYELGILSKFNFQVSNHLAFQLPRGKLLKACYNSKKSLRSFTKVSIILLGVSGVGKSCTINHLLSLAIARTSEDSSETRSTTCYSIKEKIQSLGVSNFLVDLIDTPGLSDGEGLKQDAANFKSISNYCISEFSEKIFPNIIFLFLQSNDNRYNHERSKFVLSLKQIKKLNIVCQEFPNVVVIITFACSIAFGDVEKWKEKLNQISSKIKHLVSKHLGIDSLVVWLENDYEFCGLTVSNDNNSSFLPDGTIQPANLYKAIVEQARKNNDELLENAMHHLFSNSLIRRVEVFVRITIKAKDTRLEKLDEKENKILMEMQTDQGGYVPEKIIPPAHIYMCVGAGLNILSDELKPSRLFEVDENDTYNSFGIQLPKGFQLVFVNETRKFSEYSKNQTEYVKKRLACLHFDANVDLSLFKMKTRAGFVYSSNLSNEKNSINHSLLQEVRLFKVEIKESTELKLTNEFKKHVNLLPDKYNRYDSSNKSLYQSFFNRWGHFIVSSAYGGGSVEISQFTEDAKNFEESSTSFTVSTRNII
ncbi:uncharacterized protein LOC136072228 [Hydra vulgaris]|uniref:uncharacterized protein LOC136072228 n=1 Tax=Hydra vulgaris TaxID=6087 RepID=UPI0032E9ED49